MKKILTLIMTAAVLFTGCKYDDGDLWNKVDDLDGRLKTLEQAVSRYNTDIAALQTIVTAINGNDLITGFAANSDESGWVITFQSGKTIELFHGQSGADAPIIGVAEAEDGNYYWTMTLDGDTDWLYSDNAGTVKIPVTGAEGAPAVTPIVGVNGDGFWTVDYGNGPELVEGPDGPVTATVEGITTIFTDVVDNGRYYSFILADGTEYQVVKRISASIVIDADPQEYFRFGQERIFTVTAENTTGYSVSGPRGWLTDLDIFNKELWIQAPAQGSGNSSGIIQVSVTGSDGATYYTSIQVYADTYELRIVDFEGSYWDALIDNPEYNGTLLYGIGDYVQSTLVDYKWLDSETQLASKLQGNYSDLYGWTYTYSGGGEAISNYKGYPVVGADYTGQLEIPNASGRRGSNNFVVHFGYKDDSGWSGSLLPSIYFEGGTERIVDHMWVTSTCYFLNITQIGNTYSNPMSADGYVDIVATGYDASDNITGTVTFTIGAGLKNSQAVTEWTKWDLSGLNAVNKIEFNMESPVSEWSDYGFAYPAYFAYDDVAIRF